MATAVNLPCCLSVEQTIASKCTPKLRGRHAQARTTVLEFECKGLRVRLETTSSRRGVSWVGPEGGGRGAVGGEEGERKRKELRPARNPDPGAEPGGTRSRAPHAPPRPAPPPLPPPPASPPPRPAWRPRPPPPLRPRLAPAAWGPPRPATWPPGPEHAPGSHRHAGHHPPEGGPPPHQPASSLSEQGGQVARQLCRPCQHRCRLGLSS